MHKFYGFRARSQADSQINVSDGLQAARLKLRPNPPPYPQGKPQQHGLA